MSQKITPKNLAYDKTLPPFLAALHGQTSRPSADGPDPILAGRRRPVKPRSGSAEAEDAPRVVDADGNEVLGVAIGADGAVTELETPAPAANGEGGAEGGPGGADSGGAEEAEKVAGIGATRKRKVGRVVGGEEDDEGDVTAKKRRELKKKSKDDGTSAGGDEKGAKSKKKAKKIKLSFGDGDGD